MANPQRVSEVINALNALYQGTDLQAREQANSWLEQFQKTTDAWTIADAILGTADAGMEVKIFAAQTLRNKIITSLSELGDSGALSLRDSLVGHLQNARNGPQPLITQLCLSLADLAVQLGAWKSPIADMTQSFLSDPDAVSCLLKFLSVLPDEVLNDRIILSNDFFQQRSAELLTDNASNLIQLLVRCLQQQDLKVDAHTQVLECFTSWLKNGEITLMMMQNTSLIELAFAALKVDDSTVFETAVDALCGIIYETHLDRDDDPETVAVKNGTIEQQLIPQLNMVTEQMRNDPLVAEGDEERARGYCRIFTEAGEAWVHRIVQNAALFQGLVSALVDCMRLESLDVIAMLFDFWSILSDKILEYANSCDPSRRMLTNVYDMLIDIIIHHLQYPLTYDASDSRGGWTAKERDEFREFRHNIGDVLKDCVRLVGQVNALSHPYTMIVNRIESSSSGSNSTSQQIPWQEIEAPLFALRAMGAEISPSENNMMPKIMDMFARFPAHPKLRYAATLVIGRYTEWTYEHPDYVQFQLNYIAEGFKIPEVAAASAQSLKYLCQDCAKYLAEHWNDLLKFFSEVVSSGTLDDGDVIEFSEALAHVVSAVPEANISAAIESFFLPVGQELGALMQQAGTLGDKEKAQIALLFDRIGVFLRYLNVEDSAPAQELLAQIINGLWPLTTTVLQNFASNPLISESVAKFMRVLVEFYSVVIRPVIHQIIDAIVASFQSTGLGAYLWLARRILNSHYKLGADEQESLQLVTGMIEKLSEAALAVFQQTQFSEIPEVTEDYFRLLERAIEVAPGYIIRMPIFTYIFQAAIAALEVNVYHSQVAVIRAWMHMLGPTKRHLHMMRENRMAGGIPISRTGTNGSQSNSTLSVSPGGAPGGHFPSPARTRRRSSTSRPDVYPVEKIVELCVNNGFEFTAKIMKGLMQSFDREVISDTAELFASFVAIVSDEQLVVSGQFDAPPLPSAVEWEQSLLSQIPDANLPPADKQSFIADLSESVQARKWVKIKVLMSDFAAVYWRRNAANSARGLGASSNTNH